MTDLSELVKKLTEPSFEHVFQKHDDGHGQTKTVEVASLLEQMRDRFSPSGEANGGASSIKSTRAPADLDAMFEYAKMNTQIGSWCHMVGIIATRDAATDLKAWHQKVKAILGDAEPWYRRQLAGWVRLIEDHLDGPEQFVPRCACPVCGGTSWGDAINGGDMWPILIRYRVDDERNMFDEVARCRIPGCGTVWYGHEAITELGEEVGEKRHAERTTTV